MQKTKKKSFILTLLVALLCLIAGLFVYGRRSEPMQAQAETVATTEGFYMHEGMALKKTPDSPYMRFTVNITQSMYNTLSKETTSSTNIFGKKTYYPNSYYLRITRSAEGQDDYYVNYHLDPEHSVFSSSQLELDGSLTVYLVFPYNTDFETEYTYTCQYVYAKDVTGSYMYTKEYEAIVQATASSSVTRSVGNVARAVLADEEDLSMMTDAQIAWMQHLAGVSVSTETYTVNVEYKSVVEYGRIETVTEQYQVNSLYAISEHMVYASIMDICGAEHVSDFNAVYKDPYNGDGQIILQAEGYTYTFDDSSDVGTLTITYRDYDYKNFAIRLQDNDWTNTSNLYVYLYTSDVSYDQDRVFLTFYYDSIVNACFEGLGWIFTLGKDNVTVINNTETVAVYVGENTLKVAFNPDDENDLQNLSILLLAEIIPDYECDVHLDYAALAYADGEIVESTERESVRMMYSEYIKICSWAQFTESELYDVVENAVQVEELEGQEYFIPSNVIGALNDDGSFTLQVQYDYNTLLKLTDQEGNVHFIACTKNSLTYGMADLRIAPKSGWRIAGLTSERADVAIEFDEANTDALLVTLNVSAKQKLIIPIAIEYSDRWTLDIVYMETYKETPFALKKVYSTEILVSEYNVKNMTIAQIKGLLGRQDDMQVCGLVVPDKKVKTEYTSTAKYTATVSYGLLSLKQIDYDGNSMEIRVPLTKYEDWCKTFGDDLSILYLNTGDKKYFEYSNEIPREDLYGFFSMAIFEEQVSDLNYYFKNNTGDGNMVVFETRTTTGSAAYQFFDNLRTKGPVTSALGHTAMAFCEIVNDENKVLHNVFFYLDGSDSYISNGGATDRDDTDGAAKNWFQGVWEGFTNGLEKPMQTIRIVLAALTGLALIVGIVFGIDWIVKKRKSNGAGDNTKK